VDLAGPVLVPAVRVLVRVERVPEERVRVAAQVRVEAPEADDAGGRERLRGRALLHSWL
jgi:hypothetical protein